MSRSLDDLCACCRPRFERYLELASENFNFEMIVTCTERTPAAQAQALANGTSKTLRSKHLPQKVCKKSHALDAVPKHLARLKFWAPEHPDWERLGKLGEALGLQWGGRWGGKWRRPTDRDYKIVDCCHLQCDCDCTKGPCGVGL